MNKYKEGESTKAICENCKALVNARYKVRDVPFSDGRGTVKDILAIVCGNCERVIGIPHQSTPAIKKAFEKYDK
ncbi:hypothetical protein [Opacimonas viscosa]|uniref:Uncharacterized protein n=1 Tax=Opacimonas viscosa TaxID=2961944 RepID=A0AA41X0X7_9ALTE|nr:hypothetical protein [Opacimonas viscosa]MCP3429720.1 hypothetical protein [Opacimonas viscosa]